MKKSVSVFAKSILLVNSFHNFHACTPHNKLLAEDTTHAVFVSCYSLTPSSSFTLLFISLSIDFGGHWFFCSYLLSFGQLVPYRQSIYVSLYFIPHSNTVSILFSQLFFLVYNLLSTNVSSLFLDITQCRLFFLSWKGEPERNAGLLVHKVH